MTDNRNARAQSLNEETFEGDNDVGSGRAIASRLTRGWDATGGSVGLLRQRSGGLVADLAGGGHRPEVAETLHPGVRAMGEVGRDELGDALQRVAALGTAEDPDRYADLGERFERPRCGRSLEHRRFVLAPAGQSDRSVGLVHQAVLDVRRQGVRVEAVERRLGAVVLQRILA
jgi:hypothetical protein